MDGRGGDLDDDMPGRGARASKSPTGAWRRTRQDRRSHAASIVAPRRSARSEDISRHRTRSGASIVGLVSGGGSLPDARGLPRIRCRDMTAGRAEPRRCGVRSPAPSIPPRSMPRLTCSTRLRGTGAEVRAAASGRMIAACARVVRPGAPPGARGRSWSVARAPMRERRIWDLAHVEGGLWETCAHSPTRPPS